MKVLFLICLILSINSHSRELVIVTDYIAPYAYEENGKLHGEAIEILTEVLNRSKVKYRIDVFPWKRSLSLIESKKADFILGVAKGSGRASFMNFSTEPIITISRKKFILTSAKEKGSVVGLMRGYSYRRSSKSFTPEKKVYANNHDQLLDFLLHERVDYIIGSEQTIKYFASKKNALNKIKMLTMNVNETQEHYIASSKEIGLKKILEKINNELIAFKKTSRYKEIVKKYKY